MYQAAPTLPICQHYINLYFPARTTSQPNRPLTCTTSASRYRMPNVLPRNANFPPDGRLSQAEKNDFKILIGVRKSHRAQMDGQISKITNLNTSTLPNHRKHQPSIPRIRTPPTPCRNKRNRIENLLQHPDLATSPTTPPPTLPPIKAFLSPPT